MKIQFFHSPLTSKKIYIETYGCQMNVADTEVVSGILRDADHEFTDDVDSADIVLINTCSIRENAETRVYGRLGQFKKLKERRPELVIGLLGCMAERLRSRLTAEKSNGVGQAVDIIVGPDEYRKLPRLLTQAWHGEKGIAVKLSRAETYDDILPLRTEGISAWISVMRGCDKFCTFCVVPFTRGRERSRSLSGVVAEVEALVARGFKEVTLLGQNVNSYRDGEYDFADLLAAVAGVDRRLRVRFTTSHPQDMSIKLIETLASHDNVCKYIHLPVQSGSDRILDLMKRTYTSASYRQLVGTIRSIMPDVSLSTDIIVGFPTEREEDHVRTIELIEAVQYDGAFTFKYSPRENTPAFSMSNDVSDAVKTRRINEVIDLQQRISAARNKKLIGSILEVLVEGDSKKSGDQLQGRTDGNKVVVFSREQNTAGDYVRVVVDDASSATLFGHISNPDTVEMAAVRRPHAVEV